MFLSWWLIVPVVVGVVILFIMVSRLSNEVDKLETALEESRGQLKSLDQHVEKTPQVTPRVIDNLMRVKE